jgi:hypothetical protein
MGKNRQEPVRQLGRWDWWDLVGRRWGSRIRKWAPCSTSGPSDYRAEESNNLKGKVKVETAGTASLGCGQLSVGGEAANRVTIDCWYQRGGVCTSLRWAAP